MIRILLTFGTRPEAIKMAPLVKEFQKHPELFVTIVCVTAQHREMLDQVLDFFEIQPNYDLDIMSSNQDLFSLTSGILIRMRKVLEEVRPDYMFVHGDTTTTLSASLAGFYFGCKVCHVEAGLRTHRLDAPFPEEMNRTVAGVISAYHYAPTAKAKANLLAEGKDSIQVIVTGNTVVDALLLGLDKVEQVGFFNNEIARLKHIIDHTRKLVLITGHRRESHGQGFLNICHGIKDLAIAHPEVDWVYPVHLNPHVQKPVYDLLGESNNIHLIDPLGYPAFLWLMNQAYFIITDSGGIQEEAPSLGKPVLVMRETTERPEAVEAGTVKLVGASRQNIFEESHLLLTDDSEYTRMSKSHNPYGDGRACNRIVEHLINATKSVWTAKQTL